ncbi:hypothetical protein M436DRAFT_83970 [Aureobasidium namibiae CBS 147.97]|uniref:Myb-like domain-containing protein n=1 Tax=Aureobasidium namibiae CBS 147.97 TaxID=1043004 RepID=A0A074WMK2_9PEZI
MPGITWDAEADRKILLAILRDPESSANINWEVLAAELSTDTVTCTIGALKKHISRIKIAVKDVNSDGSDSAPKTPAPKKGKAKANGTAGSSAGPKSKGKGKSASKRKVSDDSDDDDEGTPLTKKLQKAAPGQEELKVKTEGDDDEEE